uniref:Uncharacterized protein n=1 Tax=Sphaerodactylus townsendi TaxID=933632 RepID=A0ACB8E5W2_9SAUR
MPGRALEGRIAGRQAGGPEPPQSPAGRLPPGERPASSPSACSAGAAAGVVPCVSRARARPAGFPGRCSPSSEPGLAAWRLSTAEAGREPAEAAPAPSASARPEGSLPPLDGSAARYRSPRPLPIQPLGMASSWRRMKATPESVASGGAHPKQDSEAMA